MIFCGWFYLLVTHVTGILILHQLQIFTIGVSAWAQQRWLHLGHLHHLLWSAWVWVLTSLPVPASCWYSSWQAPGSSMWVPNTHVGDSDSVPALGFDLAQSWFASRWQTLSCLSLSPFSQYFNLLNKLYLCSSSSPKSPVLIFRCLSITQPRCQGDFQVKAQILNGWGMTIWAYEFASNKGDFKREKQLCTDSELEAGQ